MNKFSEAVRYFEDLLTSPRSINDTSRLGYDRKGESFSNGEKKNTKGKPTCHHCGKIGHTINIWKSKNGNHDPMQTTKGKILKQEHQIHQRNFKNPTEERFNGYCYNDQNFGHRASKC